MEIVHPATLTQRVAMSLIRLLPAPVSKEPERNNTRVSSAI